MPKDDAKKESKKRAADSAKALAKYGAVTVAGAVLGPAGAAAATLALLLPKHAAGLLKEKWAHRNRAFHEELLSGVSEEDVPRLVSKLTSDDEVAEHYASILEQVYQDDETEKVVLYARLLRHLASTPKGASRGKELERHVIRSLRALAASDLTTLRKLADLEREFPTNIATTRTLEGGFVQIDEEKAKLFNDNFRRHVEYVESLSPLESAGLRRLEYAGMVKRVDAGGGSRYEVTSIGSKLLYAVSE